MDRYKKIKELLAAAATTPMDQYMIYLQARISTAEFQPKKDIYTDYYSAWKSAKAFKKYFPDDWRELDNREMFNTLAEVADDCEDPKVLKEVFGNWILGDIDKIFLVLNPVNNRRNECYNLIEILGAFLLQQHIEHGTTSQIFVSTKLTTDNLQQLLTNAFHSWPYRTRYSALYNFEKHLFPIWRALYEIPFDTTDAQKIKGVIGIVKDFRDTGFNTTNILQFFYLAKTYEVLAKTSTPIDNLPYLRAIFLSQSQHENEANISPGERLFLESEKFDSYIKRWHNVDTVDFVRSLLYEKESERITTEICISFPKIDFLAEKGYSILLVNPNPNLMLTIIENRQEIFNNVVFAFTNLTLAQLYKQRFVKSRIATVKIVPEGNIPQIIELNIDSNHYGRELKFLPTENNDVFDSFMLFSATNNPDEITLFNSLQDRVSLNADTYWFVPNVVFDSFKTDARRRIFNSYRNINIQILPHVKSPSGLKKFLFLQFSNDSHHSNQVEFIRWFREKTINKEEIIRRDPRTVSIPQEDFCCKNHTIIQFWDRNCFKTDKTKNDRLVHQFVYSPEISLWYSWSSGRGSFYYCAYPSASQQRNNPLPRGTRLSSKYSCRAKSLNDMTGIIYRRIFNDKSLREIIRKDILQQFRSKPISLKTFWFCYLDELQKISGFNMNDSVKLFISAKLSELNSEQVYDLKTIQEIFESDYSNLPQTARVSLWKQLNIILNYASRVKNRFAPNPIGEFVQTLSEQDRGYQQVRQHMAKRSYERSEESLILEYLNKNWQKNVCLIGGAISFFTGMSNREICALNWEDYHKIIDGHYQLWVTQKVDDSKEVVPFSIEEQSCYRRIPLVSILSHLLNQYYDFILEATGKTEINGKTPLVCTSDGTFCNRCMPDMLQKTKKDMEQAAGIESFELSTGQKSTDINKYGSDRFRSNFMYRATQTCLLSEAELNYVLGKRLPTTFARHYCDYTNDFAQTIIANKLERWAGTDKKQSETEQVSRRSKVNAAKKLVVDSRNDRTFIQLDLQRGGRENVDITVLVEDSRSVDIIAYRSKEVK